MVAYTGYCQNSHAPWSKFWDIYVHNVNVHKTYVIPNNHNNWCVWNSQAFTYLDICSELTIRKKSELSSVHSMFSSSSPSQKENFLPFKFTISKKELSSVRSWTEKWTVPFIFPFTKKSKSGSIYKLEVFLWDNIFSQIINFGKKIRKNV